MILEEEYIKTWMASFLEKYTFLEMRISFIFQATLSLGSKANSLSTILAGPVPQFAI